MAIQALDNSTSTASFTRVDADAKPHSPELDAAISAASDALANAASLEAQAQEAQRAKDNLDPHQPADYKQAVVIAARELREQADAAAATAIKLQQKANELSFAIDPKAEVPFPGQLTPRPPQQSDAFQDPAQAVGGALDGAPRPVQVSSTLPTFTVASLGFISAK